MRDPVIINIRGTSGSGKTTLVMSTIAGMYPTRTPVRLDGRKQPLYYILDGREGFPPLVILGHYESPCGGCDTISKFIPNLIVNRDDKSIQVYDTAEEGNSYDTIFGLVKALHRLGYDVVFEGLLISGDYSRTLALHKAGLPIYIVALNIPLEECLRSVAARRAEKGNTKEFNPKNTVEKHKLLVKCIDKFDKDEVDVADCWTREYAHDVVKLLLSHTPRESRLRGTN